MTKFSFLVNFAWNDALKMNEMNEWKKNTWNLSSFVCNINSLLFRISLSSKQLFFIIKSLNSYKIQKKGNNKSAK